MPKSPNSTHNMSTLATRAGQLAGPPPNIVWLNAGHGGNTDDNTYDPGAPVNWPDGRQTTEAELVANFVRDVVEKVVALGNPAPKVLNHGGAPAPVKFWELTQKLKSAGKPGEYLISYHTNSAAKKDWHRVSGTETLYAITSATGERLAKALTETTTSVLGMRTPRKNLGIWGGEGAWRPDLD